MIKMIVYPREDIIEWDFQVEAQLFMTRYGTAGGFYYKQSVLQSGAKPSYFRVKRITRQIYDLAKKYHLKVG